MKQRKLLSLGLAGMLASTMIFMSASFVGCGLLESGGTQNSSPIETTKETFTYELLSDSDSYAVTGLANTAVEKVVIPETYQGKAVTEIAEEAFKNCTGITEAVVPNSVTKIGKNAFRGCRSLEAISIPFVGASANASMGKSLFGYIFGLGEYVGGDPVVQVYGENVEDYETYYIPASLRQVEITGEKIPYGAFSNCTNINTVILGATITEIEEKAFLNNSIDYLYVNGSYISSQLLSKYACGDILLNVPAVSINKEVTRVSAYVSSMDHKSDWSFNGVEYDMYANVKKYQFEAEKSNYNGGLFPSERAIGSNGVPTGGGYYLTGWYPNGGTGESYMEFKINASQDATATFYFCCGPRDQVWTFNNCWKFTVNGEQLKSETEVYLSLAKGIPYGSHGADWKEFEIMTVNLKKGENVLRLHFLPGGQEKAELFGNDMHVDYIALESYAVLTLA